MIKVINIFYRDIQEQGIHITGAQFEQNLLEKVRTITFIDDIRPLLSSEIASKWNINEALSLLEKRIFPYLKGK